MIVMMYMYKYSHGMLPQMIQDLYVTNNAVHHYATRQSNRKVSIKISRVICVLRKLKRIFPQQYI